MRHKTRKHLLRRSRGGTRIGNGRTSSVFSPPLKCSGDSNSYNSTDFVSKLTTPEIAARELENSAPLRKIDPDSRFTLVPLATCTLSDKQINLNFNSTNIYGRRNTLVIMRNGGISLTLIFNTLEKAAYYPERLSKNEIPPIDYIDDIIKSLKELGYFIINMNKAGIYHNDISSDNIVIDQDKMETRLIDFELGGRKDNLYDFYDLMSIIRLFYDLKFMIYKTTIPEFFHSSVKRRNAASYTEEKLLYDLALIS